MFLYELWAVEEPGVEPLQVLKLGDLVVDDLARKTEVLHVRFYHRLIFIFTVAGDHYYMLYSFLNSGLLHVWRGC